MLVVSPFGSHTPDADATVTADGPVTIKSVPFDAIDVQRMGELNTSFNEEGEQVTGTMLSIGTEGAAGIVKLVEAPGGAGA